MSQNILTGMTGVYSVAAELSLRNYIVAVTSRNAPGVDIIAVSPNLKKAASIQVKANKPKGTQAYWLLSERAKRDKAESMFYVFVNLKDKGMRAEFYIVPSKVVARDMEVSTRPRSKWYWFPRKEEYKDRWEILPR
ncbi:MAG: hypothetical protein ACREQA_15750 [Candidatus Binatia bacterium]